MPDRNRPTHPRPQLRRRWTPLDGDWDFALDPDGRWDGPGEVQVGPAPSASRSPRRPPPAASARPASTRRCWYRRRFRRTSLRRANGCSSTSARSTTRPRSGPTANPSPRHGGGYTPFTADVTDAAAAGEIEVVVPRRRPARPGQAPRQAGLAARAALDLVPAHDRHLADRSGWSRCPPTRIGTAPRGRPTLERWEIGLEAWRRRRAAATTCGCASASRRAASLLADDTYRVVAGEVHRRIALSDPGIDDYRNELLWSPERPTLIRRRTCNCSTRTARWSTRSWSYTALRSIAVQGDRFVLNGRPLTLRLVLDQGYWPDTGQTRAGRRRPAARRRAGEGDGVQRRPQAPEDRGPALPVLGRRAGPAGVGGDAQRLPVHADVGRAADGASGPR